MPPRPRSRRQSVPPDTSTPPPKDRAAGLVALADALEGEREIILATAASETHLTVAELTPEFDRMVGTLRLFAECIADDSFFEVAAAPVSTTSIGPGHALRAKLVPLGKVLVFGASNFPLAYGVCGGDTVSALAAGCQVIVKEHPAHPKTGRLLHRVASSALSGHSMNGWLTYARHTDPTDFGVAKALVMDHAVAAIGFTGSVPGGLAIEKLARMRAVPIPVFAEMGSLNPVLVSAAAVRSRSATIASALAASISMRVGQQCTRPGLIFVESGIGDQSFIDSLAAHLAAVEPRRMVAPWIETSFIKHTKAVANIKGISTLIPLDPPSNRSGIKPLLFQTTLPVLQSTKRLREEIFGPAAIVVSVPTGLFDSNFSAIDAALKPLPGSLTCSLFAEASELSDDLCHAVAPYAGRIILNGVPTGVRVDRAMVHSGPFPACNRPESTAVGPYAITRWMRTVCIQG
ncbi:MAG: aldehyde dehydrogenase family protein [bacterium]|nr:aldehyde dehydrogenase family protein [bacterium]